MCWNTHIQSNENVIKTFKMLSEPDEPSHDMYIVLEKCL